jgi:hypothetical protein
MGPRGAQEVVGEGAQEGRGSCMEGSYSGPWRPRKGHRRGGEGAVSALEKEGRKKDGIKEWEPQRRPRGAQEETHGAQEGALKGAQEAWKRSLMGTPGGPEIGPQMEPRGHGKVKRGKRKDGIK